MFYSPCDFTKEWFDAYVDGTWVRETWHGENEARMHALLEKHKDLMSKSKLLTTKFSTNPNFYLHCNGCINFEDKIYASTPEVIFTQRLSSFTKTFDALLFYQDGYVEIRAIPKKELPILESWCSGMDCTLYNGGLDPLPANLMVEARVAGETWESILDCFKDDEADEGSEWEPDGEEDDEELAW